MKSLIWSIPVLLSMAAVCFGELPAGSQTLTVLAGAGYSGSEFDQEVTGDPDKRVKVADPGGAFGVQYLYYVRSAPTVGVGFEILRSALQEHASDILLTDYNTRTRFQPTTVMAVGKLAFGKGRVHPFLMGGIGFHRNSFYWDLEPKDAKVWPDTWTREPRRMIEDTGTGFAGALGVGMDVFLSPSLFIGAEARVTYLGTAGYRLTSQAEPSIGMSGVPHGEFVALNLLGRIGFKFGPS